MNLLLNAFDAMKDCPANEREVVIEAGQNGGRIVEVAVRDHGTGLTRDKFEKIFQPFYTTKRDGLGMGLSICRSIVQSHGGRLWVAAKDGPGTAFHFALPTYRGEELHAGVEEV